jgi:hypothetical protein
MPSFGLTFAQLDLLDPQPVPAASPGSLLTQRSEESANAAVRSQAYLPIPIGPGRSALGTRRGPIRLWEADPDCSPADSTRRRSAQVEGKEPKLSFRS